MQTKRLTVALGLIVFIVALLLVIPSFIDWSKYQTLAQTKVKEATGYDMTIDGHMRMAILPSPHASVKGVTLKKGGGAPFLTLDEADVRVALLPLLAGRIEIADIKLEKPLVNLITYKDGTDNYMPVKKVEAPSTDPVTGEPVVAKAAPAQGQAVSIGGLKIKDGVITLRDEGKNTTRTVGINDLHVKADALSGPFDGDGDISYGDARFDVSLSTGGYKDGETLPVQLNIEEKDGRAQLKYAGILDAGAQKSVQGEASVALSDLPGLLKDLGINAAAPSLGDKAQLSGMLTASAEKFSLTNGTLTLGKTKFKTRLEGAKNAAGTNVQGSFETGDVLDLDAMSEIADSVKKEAGKDGAKKDAGPASNTASVSPAKTLVPLGFTIPADVTADIALSAAGLKYKNEKTGAFAGRITAGKGVGNAAIKLDAIPGGGVIDAAASTTATPGEITGTLKGSLQNLKTTLSDWLGVVEKKTFDQPGMPQSAALDAAFRIAGPSAAMTITSLTIGEPKINGTLSYTTGARPLVKAQLHATSWTMPAPQGLAATPPASAKTDNRTDEKQAAPSFEYDITPPQLPFAAEFDVAIDRLVKGDLIVTGARAAGTYDGIGALTLATANGTIRGGTFSAAGAVADLKNFSGVDIQAGLKTSDLESFAQAMTGKPLALKQKIGAFEGALKAKGGRDSMAVSASAQAQGYTIDAAGTLEDPLSPALPGTLNVRVRHADFAGAIRALSPGFSGGAGKPVDVSGTAKIAGKVYEISNLKGQLGGSDIAGSVKADLSGAVPAITADIASNTLDAGALLGVKNKTAKTASAAAGPSAAPVVAETAGAGQWSRDPLDTGFLRSMKLDVKIAAGTLAYGTWTITNAKAGVTVKDGSLKVSPLSGGLYGGTLNGEVSANSTGAGQPLFVNFKADVDNVAVGPFLQALTSSGSKRADGTGSLSLDIKGSGASSAALMGSLAGDAIVRANNLVIYGMNIDKLAADIVEAFDGGWKGVLSGFATGGLSGGQTAFKDFSQKFVIQNGAMPIENFRLETDKSNALIVTNGTVNFAAWNMNLQSNVQVTQPKDVPVIGITLAGPLNAPQKQVSSQALDNLVRAKVGGKVQDLVNKKLGDSPAGALINNFLGGGQAPARQQPVQQPPAQQPVPAAPAPADAAPQPQAQPEAPQPQTQKDPRQQLLEGVLKGLAQ